MTTEAKTVIVTGASQGIGAGIARAFLDRGYRVVANSRTSPRQRYSTVNRRLTSIGIGRRRHW